MLVKWVQLDLPEDKVLTVSKEELLHHQQEEELVLEMLLTALLSDLQQKDKIHWLLMTWNKEAIHLLRDIS